MAFWVQFPVVSSVPTPTSLLPKAKLAWSPSLAVSPVLSILVLSGSILYPRDYIRWMSRFKLLVCILISRRSSHAITLTNLVEVPQQTCMTKDNVTLQLTSVIYYHVTSPHKAAFGITNIRTALVERTQTTLRHVVGARVLQDVIERREELAQSIGEIIEDVAQGWGVQVESMLIKDIIFSNELQDSLSMAAQSKRIGESKIIAARAEVESAKLMRQAADILSSAPAMQIRYLEAMQAMAKTSNSKIIFMPANPTMTNQIANAVGAGEGSSSGPAQEYGQGDDAFQRAINARVIENI